MGASSTWPAAGRTRSPSSTPRPGRRSRKSPSASCRGAWRSVDRLPEMRPSVLALAAAAVSVGAAAGAAAQPTPVMRLPDVEVVGTVPLPGLGTPLADVAGNVQVFTGPEIARQRPAGIADFLEANPSSVNVNSTTGNPFQSDVSFRGFTASPLLGTPQGLSVFQDGVRINEGFGDVVNWDLLPRSA